MLKVENGKIETSAKDVSELMVEITGALDVVATDVANSLGATKMAVLDDIFNALKFAELVNMGLTQDEAFEKLNPTEKV